MAEEDMAEVADTEAAATWAAVAAFTVVAAVFTAVATRVVECTCRLVT